MIHFSMYLRLETPQVTVDITYLQERPIFFRWRCFLSIWTSGLSAISLFNSLYCLSNSKTLYDCVCSSLQIAKPNMRYHGQGRGHALFSIGLGGEIGQRILGLFGRDFLSGIKFFPSNNPASAVREIFQWRNEASFLASSDSGFAKKPAVSLCPDCRFPGASIRQLSESDPACLPTGDPPA